MLVACVAAALGFSVAPELLQPRINGGMRHVPPLAAASFEVCCGKYCSKKGSRKTLQTLQELAGGDADVVVTKADMSHTEHGCFDECTMGPNVRVGGEGGRIINGVRGEEACRELLDTGGGGA